MVIYKLNTKKKLVFKKRRFYVFLEEAFFLRGDLFVEEAFLYLVLVSSFTIIAFFPGPDQQRLILFCMIFFFLPV